MRKSIFITAAALLCLLGTGYVQAQHVPTLDEVVYGGLIHTKGSTYVNWLEDGEHYSKTEKNPAGGYDIVSYRAKDNKKETLIPASMLVKPGTNDTLSVRSFAFNADHTLALIYTNTRRVWRYDTRGDYWVLDMKSGTLKQLGKGMPESSLMFAKFSPDSRRAAYVSRNNIYVEDLSTGVITPVTTDGTAEIVNGTFDWVYEEEFFCRDGFRWSPDSKYIAYWQSDTKGTGWFDIINNVDSLYPKISRFPYPKAGTTNSAVKVGYVSADGGATTWINIPGDPRNHYIMRMDFIPDSNELFIQQMNRPQNTNKVWIASIGNPEPRNIFTDTDAAWLETNDNVTWLKDNTWFTWESERDGWRHLYRVSRDGKQIVPITKGDFDYIEQAGIDLKRGVVYFIASPDNFTQRYLYSAKLFGDGTMKRLSPTDEAGQHQYNISPDGSWAVHAFSNAVTPPVIDMVSLPSHKSVRTIEDNAQAKAEYDALKLQPKEFVKTRSGERLGRRRLVASVSCQSGIHRGEYRKPGRTHAERPRMAQVYLRRGRHIRQPRPSARHIGLGASIQFHRHFAHRHHRMERRRQSDAELHVPLSRCFPHRYCHRFRGRPTSVRHHLSGTLHEYAAEQSRRLS